MSLLLIDRAIGYGDRIAIISNGIGHTYKDLLHDSERIASALLAGQPDLNETRIAFLFSSGYDYVRVQWAI